MVDGDHTDSADPQTISRWLEFLDIYVADKVPTRPDALTTTVLDEFASFASSVSAQAPLPAIRFTQARTVAEARKEFAVQTPRVRVLFDNGAAVLGRVTSSRPTRPAARRGRRPARSRHSSSERTGTWRFGAREAEAGDLHPRPVGAASDQPSPPRRRLGGRPRLGLDDGSRR